MLPPEPSRLFTSLIELEAEVGSTKTSLCPQVNYVPTSALHQDSCAILDKIDSNLSNWPSFTT